MEEQGSWKEEKGSESVGVEDEEEVAHSVRHGGFADYHQPDLCALRHDHAHYWQRNGLAHLSGGS